MFLIYAQYYDETNSYWDVKKKTLLWVKFEGVGIIGEGNTLMMMILIPDSKTYNALRKIALLE